MLRRGHRPAASLAVRGRQAAEVANVQTALPVEGLVKSSAPSTPRSRPVALHFLRRALGDLAPEVEHLICSAIPITIPCGARRAARSSSKSSRSFLMNAPSSPTSSWLSPPAGSSSSRSRGSATSARASSTRLSVPNGSPATGRTRCRRGRRRRASRARAVRRGRRTAHRVYAPTSTLSSTVIVGNSSTFWKVRRCRNLRCDAPASAAGSCPRTQVADVRLVSRVTTLNSVVFPAPFGPIRPAICPLRRRARRRRSRRSRRTGASRD